MLPDESCAKGKYTLLLKLRRKAEVGLRVSLFITCYNDTLFPETGKAVVRVLERLGHTVEFPAGQTCCGQMHWNTGYQAEALPLLERFVEQFREAEAVVVPSSSLRGDDAGSLSDDGGGDRARPELTRESRSCCRRCVSSRSF